MYTYDSTYQATVTTPAARFLDMDTTVQVAPAGKVFTAAELAEHLGTDNLRVVGLGKTNLVAVLQKNPDYSRVNFGVTELWHRTTLGNHDDTISGPALVCHKSAVKLRP